MIKVAVVGTSNSVLKDGWVTRFRGLNPSMEVHNYSLGATTSLWGSYIVEKKNIASEYDYCVIDFCINEEQFFRFGLHDQACCAAYLAALLEKFHGKRCIPIVLIFTRLPYANELDNIHVRSIYRWLCREYGIRTIDVSGLFQKLMVDLHRPKEEFYLRVETDRKYDSNHYCPSAQTIIASLVSEVISKEKEQKVGHHHDISIVDLDKSKIEFFGCDAKTCRTSLHECTTMRLCAGSKVRVVSDQFLCGIVYWSEATTGMAYFDFGDIVIKKNLKVRWDNKQFINHFPVSRRMIPGLTIHMDPVDGSVYEKSGYEDEVKELGTSASLCLADLIVSDVDCQTIGEKILGKIKECKMPSRDPIDYGAKTSMMIMRFLLEMATNGSEDMIESTEI
jgi:hypothetical protein